MPSSETVIKLNDKIHDRVVNLLRSEPRGTVLDVGAGDGTLTARLKREGFAVQAADLVTDGFRPSDIEITVADFNDGLPFEDGRFEVVVATEIIEHLENPWHFVRELYRVTKPNGVVIVSTPNLANVYVRLFYALTGRLYNFLESAYRGIGHITPVYLWNLQRMADGRFDVEAVVTNASPIPKTPILLPLRSRFFGQCIVVKLRRKPPGETAREHQNGRQHIVRPD